MVEVVCCSGLGQCIVSSDELTNLMQVTKTLFPSSRAGVKDQTGMRWIH